MRSKGRWAIAALLTAASLVAAMAAGEAPTPCARCQPQRAYWDWKANGYALGASEEQATERARRLAVDESCQASQRYLDDHLLRCKAGCRAGGEQRTCRPRGKPECLHGVRAKNHGMWQFVCRKVFGKAALHGACNPARAEKEPAFAMCDVSTRAMKELACGAPNCAAPPTASSGAAAH